MEAALPHYYWVMWTDSDYLFQHLNVSLDTLIDQWESLGKNVHVLVSHGIGDRAKSTEFSSQSWVVFIRNSSFGTESSTTGERLLWGFARMAILRERDIHGRFRISQDCGGLSFRLIWTILTTTRPALR